MQNRWALPGRASVMKPSSPASGDSLLPPPYPPDPPDPATTLSPIGSENTVPDTVNPIYASSAVTVTLSSPDSEIIETNFTPCKILPPRNNSPLLTNKASLPSTSKVATDIPKITFIPRKARVLT
ncbi:unnamed protein product [Brassica rapa]|uniref:Uncharacterized protein n=1 Tax=Brassica campestris TaxID=3711 RepID=A0A3P5ZIV2_BRACM|nr:unnamed protein product [Brassica rapa]VDC72731.1 unnamed protein product [Brassica rapa]